MLWWTNKGSISAFAVNSVAIGEDHPLTGSDALRAHPDRDIEVAVHEMRCFEKIAETALVPEKDRPMSVARERRRCDFLGSLTAT